MKHLLLFLAISLPFSTVLAQNAAKPATETVYTYVERMPEFPGGQDKMMQYLAQNIRYPQEALMNSQEGTVFLTFVVDKTGQLTQTEILKSAAPSLDAEAMRVCQTMPKWQPGKQNGQEVAVKFTLPVRFQIGKEKSDKDRTIPNFPGGQKALVNYLIENLQYPSEAIAKGIEGKVVVSFKVLENGKRESFRVENSPHESLSNEAIRLLSAGPDWEPAEKNGKSVAARHAVSIPFTRNMIAEDHAGAVLPEATDLAPMFPGGQVEMMRFLAKNINYPKEALRKGITGRVIARFVIDTLGNISNISILKPLGGGTDQEALRVIKMMPQWEPGTQNGKAVNVQYTMPILFSISNLPDGNNQQMQGRIPKSSRRQRYYSPQPAGAEVPQSEMAPDWIHRQ